MWIVITKKCYYKTFFHENKYIRTGNLSTI